MASSKRLRWVEVNRDHTPALPREFHVSAYPSLIVIGKKNEKVFRFQSYMKPAEFLANLDEGLRRYELYKAGKPWDVRPPRPDTICDRATIQTFKAPSEEPPGGMAIIGSKLFVAQGNRLHRVDLASGKTESSVRMPRLTRGLCAHDKLLYAVEYGWTSGKPIYVLDPEDGHVVREIVTEANKVNKYSAASGITWIGDELWVLASSDHLYRVDPESGAVLAERRLPRRAWKLEFDGKHLVTASQGADKSHELLLVDPKTLQVVRAVPVNYPLSAIAHRDGTYYLMEQPVLGFDIHNKPARVWPDQMLIYQVQFPAADAPAAGTPAPQSGQAAAERKAPAPPKR